MCIKHKASVQNGSKKTRRYVDTNILSINEESRFPSTVVGPGGKGTYLTFVNVQIQFPFLAPDQYIVSY